MNEVTTRAYVLSNQDYGVLLTAKGGGFSALRGLAVTRWQPDPTSEPHGVVWYLQDLDTGAWWSTLDCEVRCEEDRVVQRCEALDIELECEIGVLAHANAEVRRIRIVNHSERRRRLALTSYAELCLNSPAADAAHPAFSKLFVQTGFDAKRRTLLAWRRLRSPDDRPLWVGQRINGLAQVAIETDRARFIGRTHSVQRPLAMAGDHAMSGTVGTVLDPIFSMRGELELQPGQTAEVELLICAADSQAGLEQIIDSSTREYARGHHEAVLGLPPSWSAGISFERVEGSAARTEPAAAGCGTTKRERFGRFSEDGAEYVLEIGPLLEPTPQPWINVIANEQCGFLISETGAGYTWAANSRENRLTPWRNDPVTDPFGEALYLRDDDDGSFWSVLPGPAPAAAVYEVRHGFGYSSFAHTSHGLRQTATVFVPRHDPVKIAKLQVRNESGRTRRLSLVSYAQLVLGGIPAETRGAIHTTHQDGVIFARNEQRGEFAQRVAFAAAAANREVQRSATASRRVFLGDQGTLEQPAALRQVALEPQFGPGRDACAALQLTFALEPDATIDCAFLLGEAGDERAARACVARYHDITNIDAALDAATKWWKTLLSAVQVRTPVAALDLMFNGWLAYQNLACRMLARSAFYQSGGAFGFRDQLQDSSALLYLDPGITREQILLHAAHQFTEGDVLHWWHPPAGKGIRTRFSDDLLWLPQITHFYLSRTGDEAILDEPIRFIAAQPLVAGEDEIFVWPKDAGESASLYEHCCRTIDRSLTKGGHGLPLMGVGDWNDGMNRVGREGRGESVWLGFFLFDILEDWIPLCEARGERARAARYRAYRQDLYEALNDTGWDGGWYRRAYYDDGTPLGSAHNDECRIDALAQAWAVISGVAPAERAAQALAAMREHLVSEEAGIIRLLTPAFDRTPHDPGYIKGYVPGVRENGGQYTHAALWAVRALAEHGEHEHAARLLEMLSPVTRSANTAVYQGEPYVIAADVYGEPPHVGRAGWTWYTGSAGWMYRVLLESILGFELRGGDTVRLRPCLPASWPGYSLRYRLPDGTVYQFEVERSESGSSTTAGAVKDGAIVIPLERDGAVHTVRVRAGADVRPRYQPRSSAAPLLRTTSE